MHRVRRQWGRWIIPALAAAAMVLALALPALAVSGHKLTIETNGTGTGTVQCEVEGGSLEACDAEYPEGTELVVVPEAGVNSEFIEFSGDCGPLACFLAMDEDHTAIATFDLEPGAVEYSLTIAKAGTGTGTVQCEVEGGPIGSCDAKYPEGTELSVLAEADPGSSFAGFSGNCTGSSCELTMNAAKSVTATFNLEAAPEFALSIAKAGTGAGAGTVLCEAQEGPEACPAKYLEGTEVTLLPEAGGGSTFTGFSGDCTGPTCTLTMDAARSVTATFDAEAKPSFALKVKKTGTGTGKVTSSPAGIDCGVDCEESYEEGKAVTLSQLADAGSEFVKWTGACTGSGACEVTMSVAKEVTAEFKLKAKPSFALKVKKTGTGTGKVTSSPAGIDCGVDCEESYEEGKAVTLSQLADAGSEFVKWTGACTGSGACEVTMSVAKEVTAEFKLKAKPSFALKVKKTGTGTGKVTSSPAGIDCGVDCEESYEEGKAVTLSQLADAGSEFVKWTGACTGSGACEVTMSVAKEVTAEFKLKAKPSFALKVKKTGTGTGKVTSSPAGIDCGVDCEESYEEGKAVTLSQLADAGSEFVKWTGACTGSGACEVTMSVAKEVTAEFKLKAKPSFALKVKKTGTGTGKVTSSPAGIDCGVDCEESYEEGKAVTLSQLADAGSEFVKWTGACTGSGACEVTMSVAKEVTAEFKLKAKPSFALKVKKTGTGTGKVTSSPAGIDCGVDCEESYEEGKAVTLSQLADAGSEFVKWTGACTGSGACEVTMSVAKEVTAEFKLKAKPSFALAIEKIGTGTVTSSPAGIDCGSDCEEEFPEDTEVTLTAVGDEGSAFDHWTGSGCTIGSCVVTMSRARTIKAVFDATGQRTLTVSKAGTGAGTVTSAPKGIDCGTTCSAGFDVGKKVNVLAVAAADSTFTGFSGACTGTGPCQVTMSEARSLTATFEANPGPQPGVGLVVVAGTARVKNGKALLRVFCNGPSPCKGELKIGLKVPGSANGGQAKRIVVIGKGFFDLQPGASTRLAIPLSRRALAELEDRKALGARVRGTGIHPHALRLKNV